MRKDWILALALVAATACKDKDDNSDDTGDSGDSGDSGDTGDTGDTGVNPNAICTEPTDVPCVDEIILDLSLHDDKVSSDEVSTTADGDDFVTYVDASAGGYNQATNNPWVYVKFTESGATRVDIDDETALESMDWDLAMRRYIIRLNSGDSGPSCVGVHSLSGMSYGEVTEVPAGTTYDTEDFYDSSCALQGDNSGLPDSPDVAMGVNDWWTYDACVQTTEKPNLLQLADGHVLKLVVEAYYSADQDICNSTGSGGDGSAEYTLRWRMLE